MRMTFWCVNMQKKKADFFMKTYLSSIITIIIITIIMIFVIISIII